LLSHPFARKKAYNKGIAGGEWSAARGGHNACPRECATGSFGRLALFLASACRSRDLHLVRISFMSKFFFAVLFILLLAISLLGCGDSTTVAVPQPQTNNAFVFLQEVPNQTFAFTPTTGQFVTTGDSTTFEAIPSQDPVTGDVTAADFGSVYLSPAGDLVTYDLWGGIGDVLVAQWDVYVASSDGSITTQITNDAFEDSYPQLSWDGRKVVFNSRRDLGNGVTDVVVVRSATNPLAPEMVLPMPRGATNVWDPTFSPDGTKIAAEAFGSNDVDGSFDGLVVMNVDGSNPQLITNPLATCDCWDGFPAFTLDGGQIVFTGGTNTTDGSFVDIYITNLDGSGTTQLTDTVGNNADPLVVDVPGLGTQIAFTSTRDNLNATESTGYDLYTMNLDGSGLFRLTQNSLFDGFSQEWFVPPASGETAKAAVRARHGHKLNRQSGARLLRGFKW
jgi:hypothetical protein